MKMTGSVIFLPVKDLARTREFYTQIMGLRLAMVQPGGAEIYDTGYGYWGFCAYGDGRPALSRQLWHKGHSRFRPRQIITGSPFTPAFWQTRMGTG